MKTVLIKEQKREYRGEYPGHLIIATVRYDDQCNNGHNTFSITGIEYEKDGRGKWVEGSTGAKFYR